MKTKYEIPEMTIDGFAEENIITTSNGLIDGGFNGDGDSGEWGGFF